MVKWLNGSVPFSHLTMQPFFIMIKYYSVNGQVVPKEEASIGIADLAIWRGYALFDFFLVKKGHPLFFDDYLDRMERSAKTLQLKIPLSRSEMKQHIYELINVNKVESAGIKLVLTGGYSPDNFTPTTPNLIMLVRPAPTYPKWKHEDGVKLMLHEYHRTFPAIKSINYIVGVNLLPQMNASDSEDILFHFGGHIHETVRANFFIVKDDQTLVTTGQDVLEGITRKQILRLAEPHYKIELRDLKLEELHTAKEAFITSTTKQVMPVIKVDDTMIGNGRPGEVTKHLLDLLNNEESAYLATLTA
ncbi:MAG: aminotransferase class IV [Bacteroidota bacterium]